MTQYLEVSLEETVALMEHSAECEKPLSMALGGGLEVSDDNLEYLIKLGEMRGLDVSKYRPSATGDEDAS